MDEKWYVATLIVQLRQADHDQEAFTCDEQIRLLRAADEQTAYDKAVELGKNEEVSYLAVDGGQVFWEFLGLSALVELDSLQDGVEVKSRLFEHPKPDRLVMARAELVHSGH